MNEWMNECFKKKKKVTLSYLFWELRSVRTRRLSLLWLWWTKVMVFIWQKLKGGYRCCSTGVKKEKKKKEEADKSRWTPFTASWRRWSREVSGWSPRSSTDAHVSIFLSFKSHMLSPSCDHPPPSNSLPSTPPSTHTHTHTKQGCSFLCSF